MQTQSYKFRRCTITLILIAGLSLGRHAQAENNFETDLTLIKRHISPVILSDNDKKIVVSPELQGRILVATSNDFDNQSIGWINREHLNSDVNDTQQLGGGADRLWFGPDGGKFSVFFEPRAEPTTDNIRVPPTLAKRPFHIKSKSSTEVTFENTLSFQNHLGFEFETKVKRLISIFSEDRVVNELGMEIPAGLSWLAYGSDTQVTNDGKENWTPDTGLFSIWSLSTFAPTAIIAIPLKQPLARVTNYFDPPSGRQTRISNKTVFYNADANFMNKIGIPPKYTLPFIGSYNKKLNRLTIIKFRISDLGAGYVNAVWDWNAQPLDGEIINIFNDGIQENGKPFGPFYEMETSSSALALKTGQRHSHYHYTFHFTGSETTLDLISKKILGVTLQEFDQAFQ